MKVELVVPKTTNREAQEAYKLLTKHNQGLVIQFIEDGVAAGITVQGGQIWRS